MFLQLAEAGSAFRNFNESDLKRGLSSPINTPAHMGM